VIASSSAADGVLTAVAFKGNMNNRAAAKWMQYKLLDFMNDQKVLSV
jgi:hypothetical protein